MSITTEQLADEIAAGVEQLVSGADWQHLLNITAYLPQYSARNLVLLFFQAQQRGFAPTRVAGYRAWAAMGRQVRKGERSLRVLAPCVYRSTDDAGQEIREVRGFRAASVFDITQTDGPALPQTAPSLLTGEAPAGLWDDLAALVAADGYTIERGDCGATANGWVDFGTRTVRVRDDVDDAQAVKTLAHELGHIRAGHADPAGRGRGRREVEAESIACVVVTAHGGSTKGYTLPYVAAWAQGDAAAVLGALGVVNKVAGQILADLADLRSAAAAA